MTGSDSGGQLTAGPPRVQAQRRQVERACLPHPGGGRVLAGAGGEQPRVLSERGRHEGVQVQLRVEQGEVGHEAGFLAHF